MNQDELRAFATFVLWRMNIEEVIEVRDEAITKAATHMFDTTLAAHTIYQIWIDAADERIAHAKRESPVSHAG